MKKQKKILWTQKKKEETKEEKTEETKEEKTEEHEDKVENDEENKMDEDEKTETKEEKTDTKEDKTVKKRKTQTVYHPLKIQRSTAGLPQEKIKEYQTLEEKLIKEDLYVAQVAFTKNALESYIYDSRSKLTEAWSEFAAEDEKIEFGTLLEETLRWFESEGEDQTYKIYKEKLDALQSWGNKFQKRLLEFEERPGAIEFLLSTIENYKKKTEEAKTDENFSHIAQDKLDSVIAECNRVFDLISEKLQVQEKRKKYEDVVVLSSDLKDRATNLAKFGDNILTIPKPKPKEEKKTEKKRN